MSDLGRFVRCVSASSHHPYLSVTSYLSLTGNFIDTSNNYQFEESEQWIGEWMKKRGVRDQMGTCASDFCLPNIAY
jgi:aryl-alcohol dehydrogenase-like predicted oxidoreductase